MLQDLEDEVETWESVYGSEDGKGSLMAGVIIGASVILESSSDRPKQQPSSEPSSETTPSGENSLGDESSSRSKNERAPSTDKRGPRDSSGTSKKKTRSSIDDTQSQSSNDPECSSGGRIAI